MTQKSCGADRGPAQKKSTVAVSSFELYEKAVRKFLAFLGPHHAAKDLGDIRKQEIAAFRDSLKVSATTVNNDLKTVRMLFRSARRDGLIDTDPAEFVETVKRRSDAPERRPFTLPEIRRVLRIADDVLDVLEHGACG